MSESEIVITGFGGVEGSYGPESRKRHETIRTRISDTGSIAMDDPQLGKVITDISVADPSDHMFPLLAQRVQTFRQRLKGQRWGADRPIGQLPKPMAILSGPEHGQFPQRIVENFPRVKKFFGR